jgi:hypothetical protein
MNPLDHETRKARKAIYDHAYYVAHLEERRAYLIAYSCERDKSHPERARERSRKYEVVHRDERNAAVRARRAADPDHLTKERQWREGHREGVNSAARRWRERYPEKLKEAQAVCARRRREATFFYIRMDPWPTVCQCCHETIDPTRKHRWSDPDPLGETVGHEPPISWLLKNQDYPATLSLRPEHFRCNMRKHGHPDWEMA